MKRKGKLIIIGGLFWLFSVQAVWEQDAYYAWQESFERYLMAQSDPNVQAYGVYLASLSSADEIDSSELLSVLEQALASDGLNERSMNLLAHACAERLLAERCPHEAVFEQLVSQAPDNLNSYWLPLNQAISQDDKPLVRSIMGQMQHASRSRLWSFFGPDYEAALDAFVASHPIPQEVIDHEIKVLYERSRKTEAELAQLSQNMQQYMLLLLKISSNMSWPVASFRPWHDWCLENPDMWDDCLAVAELMSQFTSDSYPHLVGFGLQAKIRQAKEQPKLAAQALAQEAQARAYYQCLVSLANDEWNVFNMNLKRQHQVRMVKAEQGELPGLYHHAELKYNAALAAGHEPPAWRNPANCPGANEHD